VLTIGVQRKERDALRNDQHRLAMRLYEQAMAIVDPIRLKMWSDAELTTSQLRILFALRTEPGLPLRHLAREMQVSPPTASGLVDRLVRQGFIRREEDPDDRRLVRHHLTPRGLRVVSEIEREAAARLDSIFSRLSTDELATLISGLTLLSAAAAEDAPAGAKESAR
jgi:DNA-binding MarR family transcriptional regulator